MKGKRAYRKIKRQVNYYATKWFVIVAKSQVYVVISSWFLARKNQERLAEKYRISYVTPELHKKYLSAEKVHDNVHKITQTLFMKPSEFIQRKQTQFESISKTTSHYSASTKSHGNIYLKNKKLRKGWRCWNIISIQRYMGDKFLRIL